MNKSFCGAGVEVKPGVTRVAQLLIRTKACAPLISDFQRVSFQHLASLGSARVWATELAGVAVLVVALVVALILI